MKRAFLQEIGLNPSQIKAVMKEYGKLKNEKYKEISEFEDILNDTQKTIEVLETESIDRSMYEVLEAENKALRDTLNIYTEISKSGVKPRYFEALIWLYNDEGENTDGIDDFISHSKNKYKEIFDK